MKAFLVASLLISTPVFAGPPGETVVVEGPREPGTGPINPGTGPLTPGVSTSCPEPTCGGTVAKPEPGEKAKPVEQGEKEKKNKNNSEKVKELGKVASEAVKKTLAVLDAIKKFFSFSVDGPVEAEREKIVHPDGSESTRVKCKSDFHAGSGSAKNPCVEIMTVPQDVRKPDGSLEQNLIVHYTILDGCYFMTAPCPVKRFSFIVASEEELYSKLNEAIGEDYF